MRRTKSGDLPIGLLLTITLLGCSPDAPVTLNGPLAALGGQDFLEALTGTTGYRCVVAGEQRFAVCKSCALLCSSSQMDREPPAGLHLGRKWIEKAVLIRAVEEVIEVDGLIAIETPMGAVDRRYKSGPLILPLHDALLESNSPYKARKILLTEPDLPAGLLVELVYTASRHEGTLEVLDPTQEGIEFDLPCAAQRGPLMATYETNWMGRPKSLGLTGVQWLCAPDGHAPPGAEQSRTTLTLTQTPQVMLASYFNPADANDEKEVIELAITTTGFAITRASKHENTRTETLDSLDYQELSYTLQRWRDELPRAEQLVLIPTREVPADVVLRTMSAAHFPTRGSRASPIFSRVALSNATRVSSEEIVNYPFDESE